MDSSIDRTLNRCAHGMYSHRICEICEAEDQALERAAKLAENWGNAPPNPHGRRAALAAAIRAMKVRYDCVPVIENIVSPTKEK